jgi:molybdopterin-dependent oxidoreductase alpha subunit
MRRPRSGGGWPAIWYALRKGREAGGLFRYWRALRSKNACKTCALGMGGQQGGMTNELGHWPEVCKKSLQAMTADMQGAVRSDFWQTYSVPQLQRFTPRELEASGRLVEPLLHRRGEDNFRPISWDEALGRLAEKLRATQPDETFWYFSGRSSNEAGYLLQLFARVYGTNNVNNCSYYCHQASGVGLSSSVGQGTGTIRLEDWEQADLVFLIGANPASNHPRLMRTLMQVRRRGGEVIVINPLRETGLVNFRVPSDVRSLLLGSPIASLYVQPHVGGDLALLLAVAKRIDEMRGIDQEFLAERCEGWKQLSLYLRSLAWEDLEAASGVSRDQIDDIAERYARAQSVVFAWTMGITHHVHGVENVQAIANLALMRGMVGRPHAGLMPIRGHSNVQGIGSVGVVPRLKDAIHDRIESYFDVKLPDTPGLDTIGSLEAAANGRLRVGVCLGGNLYGASPDAASTAAALGKLDLLVYLSTTLNTGHAHGLAAETIVLPVLARDEEPQPTTQESMFSFVRYSDGGPARHTGPRSELAVVAELAGRVLGRDGPVDWPTLADATRVRTAIAQTIPGYEPLAEIDATKREFHIAGRALDEPRFPTTSGRARLHVLELPRVADHDGRLRLATIRSEGQFNTVVYEDCDFYRGIDRRDVILIHPDDANCLGLREDQAVVVVSDAGQWAGVRVRIYPDIKAGSVAMYAPEANVLVPRTVDPHSRTPAFKNVRVTVAALPDGWRPGDELSARPAVPASAERQALRSC